MTGYNSVGGLVGSLEEGTGNVKASYSLGNVKNTNRDPGGDNYTKGGLVGDIRSDGGGTIHDSYFDSSVRVPSGGNHDGAQPTSALQNPADYTGIYANWNLDLDGDGTPDDPWDFGRTDQYPALKGYIDNNGDGESTWKDFGIQGRYDHKIVDITTSSSSITEGQNAEFIISIHPTASQDVTVNLRVASGGGDYGVANGPVTVTIPAGQPSVIHSVPTVDDSADDATIGWVQVTGALPVTFFETETAFETAVIYLRKELVAINDNDPPSTIIGNRQPQAVASLESERVLTTRNVSRPGMFELYADRSSDPNIEEGGSDTLTYVWKQTHGPDSNGDASVDGHSLHPSNLSCVRRPLNQFCTIKLNRSDAVVLFITGDTTYKRVNNVPVLVENRVPLGEYRFELRVTDAAGLWSAATVSVIATDTAPPVAVAKITSRYQAAINAGYIASDDFSIQGPGTRVTLSGLDSINNAGGSLRYSWQQTCDEVDGAAAECPFPVSLSGANGATPSFTAPDDVPEDDLPVELRFQLTVTDSQGNQDTDEVTVEVDDLIERFRDPDSPPQAVIKDLGRWLRYLDDDARTEVECTEAELDLSLPGSPGNPLCHYEEPSPVTEGFRLTLDGRESNDDLDDGRIVSYLWEQIGSTGGTLANANRSRATFTTPTGLTSDEAYTIRLTVTDDVGLTDSDEITIQVTAAPIADAGDLVVVEAGERFTLRGSGTGYPGEALTYDWSETDSPTQIAFDAPIEADDLRVRNLTLTAPDVATDTSYTWTLTVTDSDGLTASSDVIVRVRTPRTAAQQSPPTVDAGPDQTVVQGDDVALSGQASHPVNEPLTGPEWTQTGGPEIPLYYTRDFTPSFTAPDVVNPVRLTFRLKVCIYDPFALESEEICSTDDVVVRVLRQPSQPTVNAGEDQVAVRDEEVRLVGLAGQAAGEALTYEWTQTAGTTALLDDAAILNPTFTVPPVAATETLTFRLTVCVAGRLDPAGEAICAFDDVDVKALPAAVGSSGAGGDGGGGDGGGGPVISELTPCVLDLGAIPGGTALGGTECDYSIERKVRYFRFTLSQTTTVPINLVREGLSASVTLPAGSYTVEVVTERTISANGQPLGPFRMYISVATN